METNQKLFLGQYIRIKSTYPLYRWTNNKQATVVGFDNDQTKVRPDAALKKVLLLYPHEIRDTDPPRKAPPFIEKAISELAQAAS